MTAVEALLTPILVTHFLGILELLTRVLVLATWSPVAATGGAAPGAVTLGGGRTSCLRLDPRLVRRLPEPAPREVLQFRIRVLLLDAPERRQ